MDKKLERYNARCGKLYKLKGEGYMSSLIRSIVMGMVVMAMAWSVNADTTLRAHFNDTSSWNIDTGNDDYAKGNTNAILTSSGQAWSTGFFPGSSPEDKAFYATNTSLEVSYSGNDGNVPITNPTGSVMTVGFWCKMTGVAKSKPLMIRDSAYKNYLMYDFGTYTAGGWALVFKDETLTGVEAKTDIKPGVSGAAYITNWMYIATVVDTGNKVVKLYQYDRDGNLISAYSRSVTLYSWDVTNGVNARVTLNYSSSAGSTNYIDELIIDNRELSQSEIWNRVNKMVGGTQLDDSDSFTLTHGTPPGPTNTTFLAHFNDNTSLDINLDNNDFSGGDYTAAFTADPAWSTGFFTNSGASTPDNRASSSTVKFDADDGNVAYDSVASGGITVGCWVKNPTDVVGKFFRIGSGDYIWLDYGQSGGKKIRCRWHEGSEYISPVNSSILTGNIENWVYIAITVDLTANMLTQYQYDNTGTTIGAPLTQAITGDDWDITNSGSYVEVYGSSTIMIDEFSIDNYVLTQTEIESRVARMVAGKEIGDKPPSGTFIVIE